MRSTQARVARLEARLLAFIRDQKIHRKLGFSCFADLVRMFQMAPRTAQEHVLLHRLLEDRPRAEEAFSLGSLSLHQVLALAPVLREGDLDPDGAVDWIEAARGLTVSGLRRRVREVVASESCGDGDGNRPDPVPEDLPDRMISFTAPLTAACAWDRALEMARCVLGWDAPVYACVEAILAEASPETASLPGVSEREAVFSGAGARVALSGPMVAEKATSLAGASLPATRMATVRMRYADARPRTAKPPARIPWAQEKARREALHTLGKVLKLLRTLSGLEGSHDPASPREAAHRLRDLQKRSRSIRALLSRLLRDLRDTGAFFRLGYRSFDDIARELGLSERAARELRRQADVFEDHPVIEEAFAQCRIGSEQACRIARLATPRTEEAFIARAEQVTTRQFAREMRFLERLRDLDPSLSASHAGPLPREGLEAALRAELLAWGWSEEGLRKELKNRRLLCPEGEDQWTGDLADPACNPVVMRRLELFFDLLVQAVADPARLRSAAEPAPGKREGSAEGQGGVPGMKEECTVGEGGAAACEREPKTSASETMDRLCDPQTDRQTSARFDRLLSGGRRESAMTRLRFRAPLEIAGHWERAIAAVRGEYAVEIPGPPLRIEQLPVWAAVLLLLHRATEVWKRQDPETMATEERILKRDEHRCRIPGCSRRRNLEAHHIRYRSRGGSDRMRNKTSACHGHHKAIHEGVVRVTGEAPHGLIVELGCEEGRPPLFVLHGEKILRTL